jgi:DNA-binding NtrC family response regulator
MGKLDNARILVIDKDIFARHSLADDLASYSATVRMAHGIDDASELMQQSTFDAVVFDVDMIQDGLRRLLRKTNHSSDNKPVFIAYSSLSNINRCMLASPEIFRIFIKPCNTNGIVDSIYMHLNKA